MSQQIWNGHVNQGYAPDAQQAQQGQWTWYRQQPPAEYVEHPSSHHHHHLRMTEQILHLTRENHRLLRELHSILHSHGKPSPFSTVGTETMSIGTSIDMREPDGPSKPTS